MRLPFGWTLPIVIVLATAVAIWADPSSSLAVFAGVVALVAAGVLFGEAWMGAPRTESRSRRPEQSAPSGNLRAAFRSGRFGRESIVDLVDRLERQGSNPGRPARSRAELARLLRLSPAEFRHELNERLDDLERRA